MLNDFKYDFRKSVRDLATVGDPLLYSMYISICISIFI